MISAMLDSVVTVWPFEVDEWMFTEMVKVLLISGGVDLAHRDVEYYYALKILIQLRFAF